VQRAYAEACNDLGLTHTSLTSGAGHDGQSLADLCPVGMIFVPSVDGASHSPREFTKWEDCVNGANVLLQTVLRLGIS
ncbi:MAG TPA: M20/M25/M40 family metallo-hydrolase, partial [Anaerolineales bacterium]|nr:M20/M25/M40 family metallo-hydrolase [Anaerolineales bacterium]